MTAGFERAATAANMMEQISRETCRRCLRDITTPLKDVSDGAGETVAPVVEMRQRADAEERTANARRDARHGAERVVEEVAELEDDGRRWREVEADRGACAIQIEVRERAIQTDNLIAYNRRDVSAVVELAREKVGREVVRAFDVEAVLPGR